MSDPIDPQALKNVFGDDAEIIRKILGEFVTPSREIVRAITDAASERSAEGVAAGAHQLKSSARAVGANGLADLCVELESAGKASNWAVIDALVSDLPGHMDRVSAFVGSL